MSAALRELLAKAKFGEFSVSGTGFLLEGKHMFGDGVYGDAAPALAALLNNADALLAKSAAYDALVLRAYQEGWHECAEWAGRDDLHPDVDSKAYADARDKRLLLVREGGDGK